MMQFIKNFRRARKVKRIRELREEIARVNNFLAFGEMDEKTRGRQVFSIKISEELIKLYKEELWKI